MVLSVIIPFHAVNDLLERAIESILCQIDSSVEVLLIGDGISQHSLLDLQKLYPLLYVTSIGKSGANSARMYGLSQSKGDYVLFVDSDDTLAPGAIQEYFSIIHSYAPDLIVGNTIRIKSSGIEKILYKFRREKVLLAKNELKLDELYTFPILINKCFKKALFSNYNIPDSALFQDAPITVNLFLNAHSFYFSNTILYHYYLRENSTSNKTSYNLEELTSIEELINAINLLHKHQSLVINRYFISIFSARLYFTLLLRSFDLNTFAFSEGIRKRGYGSLKKYFATLVKQRKTLLIFLLFSNALLFRLFFYLKRKK